jgi:diguanylate cyclase (GGDEF)-like protein
MRRFHPRQFESKWTMNGQTENVLTMEVLACPLTLADQSVVLQIIARDISFRREAEAKMQSLLGDLQVANTKLNALATVDEMTGLFNFRYLKEQLALEHERARRYATPYSIVFTDIDHFKHYNDRNGHPAGDALLREVAQIMRASVRLTDVPARYGGEEFCMLLPETSPVDAMNVLEGFRAKVEAARLQHGEKNLEVTVSVGLASSVLDGSETQDLFERADETLYTCKNGGRNQVRHFAAGRMVRFHPTNLAAEIDDAYSGTNQSN